MGQEGRDNPTCTRATRRSSRNYHIDSDSKSKRKSKSKSKSDSNSNLRTMTVTISGTRVAMVAAMHVYGKARQGKVR